MSKLKENIESAFSKRRKKGEVKEKKPKKKNEDIEENGNEKQKDNVREKKTDTNIRKTKDNKRNEENTEEAEDEFKEVPDEEKYEALVIVPPDGGWGWVIVFCCFLILVCSDGSMNSYGTFSFHIEDEFHVKVAEISIVSSVATCLYYVCGPVWGALGNRYGFRPILIIGAAVMALGNFGAFFIKSSFISFAAFYAIGIGTGGGMIFMSASVMVGVYFDRWRGYAISIVSCGSSLGTVFMPPMYNAISVYGWRFVLVLNCCLLCGCMFLGLFLRPLKPTLITTRPEPKQVQFKGKHKKEEQPKKAKPGTQVQNTATHEVLPSSSFVTLKGVGTAGGSSTSVYISTQEGRPPSTPPTEEQLDGAGARPMYRDDIFYAASAARLGSQLSQTICMLGYHAPFLFTFSRAKDAGMEDAHSAWLIPLMGIANTIGRLLCGAIVEIPGISALHLTGVSFAVGGLFTIISCFNLGHHLQFAYVVIFGLMAAAFMALKSIILVDYLGIERLTNAFGLLLMFQGFASLCGPPLAGVIADETHNYNNAFYCSGIFALVGGFSGFLVIPLKKYEIRKGMRVR